MKESRRSVDHFRPLADTEYLRYLRKLIVTALWTRVSKDRFVDYRSAVLRMVLAVRFKIVGLYTHRVQLGPLEIGTGSYISFHGLENVCADLGFWNVRWKQERTGSTLDPKTQAEPGHMVKPEGTTG
jgi:hypothetical protein